MIVHPTARLEARFRLGFGLKCPGVKNQCSINRHPGKPEALIRDPGPAHCRCPLGPGSAAR
ncbi:hypothetical protein SGCZBJ_11225 [Caulobacter zeae]|uniref:Uncharacterized protein n=1 Tax=Caulobacter zeae TaxID=2055137 RepID=A0A2N5DHT1_9CAUL|nr:hypothetical protein SGCZBJ_11225 [Caulobacter zeae]